MMFRLPVLIQRVTVFGGLLFGLAMTLTVHPLAAQEHRLRLSRDDNGEVVELWYSGDADWVLAQESETSRWHEFSSLEAVGISHTRVTADLLDYVSRLPAVKTLIIGAGGLGPGETDVDRGAYDSLDRMKGLEYLEIVEVVNGDGDREFLFLGELESLRELWLSDNIGDDALQQIARLTNLESIWCFDVNDPSRRSLLQFARLPKLNSIRVGRIDMDSELLTEFITEICQRELEELRFKIPESHTFSCDNLELICALEQLTSLEINNIPAESASRLGQLKKLDMFNLSFRGTLQDFDFLGELPKLRLFYLNAPDVHDASLNSLRDHPTLKYVGMSRHLVIDEELVEVFETIPNLAYVGAKRTDVPSANLNERFPDVRFEIRHR